MISNPTDQMLQSIEHQTDWLKDALRATEQTLPDDDFAFRVSAQLPRAHPRHSRSSADSILWIAVILGTIPAALWFPFAALADAVVRLCSNPVSIVLIGVLIGSAILGRVAIDGR